MARITIGSATDVGMRDDNEDSVLATLAQDSSTRAGHSGSSIASAGLLILADGMGGRAHGKVASETATITIYRELAHILVMRRKVENSYILASIKDAISKANSKITELGAKHDDAEGMGTTAAVAIIMRNTVCVGHVGDSRIYLLTNGSTELQLLTEDHSVVQAEVRAGRLTMEEARTSKMRNMITRAVGVSENVDVDVKHAQLPAESISYVVVSSDGMHGSVTESEIVRILREHPGSPQEAADCLIEAARENGARDNISAIVAAVDTRYGIESCDPDGVDAVANGEYEMDGVTRNKARWLTPANILSFIIGMTIMAGIAWRFFPGMNITAPNSDSNACQPPTDCPVPPPKLPEVSIAVSYDSPVTVFKGPLLPSYLNWVGGNVFQVDDIATHQLVSVDVSSGKVVGSKTDKDAPIPPSPKQYLTTDNAGNQYFSQPFKGVSWIDKTNTDDGLRVKEIGVGMLTSPAALQIAPDGDIIVIDNGTLKRFQAVVNPSPKPESTQKQ